MRRALALVLLLAPVGASADEPGEHAGTWLIATSQVAVATSTVFELAVLPDTRENGLRLTIMGIGSMAVTGLVGYLAWRGDWTPLIPRAMQGALWAGLDLLILGTVLPFALGMESAEGLEFGPVAWTLGALGLIEGALAGALIVDDGDETDIWLGQGVGLFAGLLLVGIFALASGGSWGPDEGGQWIGWTMFFSIGATVGGAHIYAASSEP